MAVAGHRSAAQHDELDDVSDDDAEESREALLDELLRTAHRAAVRLDGAARMLAGIAWSVLTIGVVAGISTGVIGAVTQENPAYLVIGLVLCVAAFLIFLPMYFTPTWARAYAAKMMVDVEVQWGEVA